MSDGSEESTLTKREDSSETLPTGEIEKQRTALEIAENKLDRQLQLSRDIENKSIRLIKVNLLVLGAFVTAVSVSPTVLQLETVVGAILLAFAMLAAFFPLTPADYRLGITKQNLEKRKENDTLDYLTKAVDKYGEKIEANTVALSSGLLGISRGRWLDISLALSASGFTSFSTGFVTSKQFTISDVQATLLVASLIIVTSVLWIRALWPAFIRGKRMITEYNHANDMASNNDDDNGDFEDESSVRKNDDDE